MLYYGFPHVLVGDSVFVGDAKDLFEAAKLNAGYYFFLTFCAINYLIHLRTLTPSTNIYKLNLAISHTFKENNMQIKPR